MDQQNTGLGGSASLAFSPAFLAPGKYRSWCQAGQPCTFAIQRWNGASWDYMIQVAAGSATAFANIVSYEFTAPVDEWQALVTNTVAGATNFYLVITGPY